MSDLIPLTESEQRLVARAKAEVLAEVAPILIRLAEQQKTAVEPKPNVAARFYEATKGWWTAVACAVFAVAPALIEQLAGFDWTTIGINPKLAPLIALFFFALRSRTTTPIFSSVRIEPAKEPSVQPVR